MAEFGTNERVLRSDVSPEECKKIEKVLRKNNIHIVKSGRRIRAYLSFSAMRRMRNVTYIYIWIRMMRLKRHWVTGLEI